MRIGEFNVKGGDRFQNITEGKLMGVILPGERIYIQNEYFFTIANVDGKFDIAKSQLTKKNFKKIVKTYAKKIHTGTPIGKLKDAESIKEFNKEEARACRLLEYADCEMQADYALKLAEQEKLKPEVVDINVQDLVEPAKLIESTMLIKSSPLDGTEKSWREVLENITSKDIDSIIIPKLTTHEVPSDNILLNDMRDTFSECLTTAIAKNSDYGGSNKDPFANFQNSTIVNVPIEKGIMVRMMDKVSRITTLLDKEAKVKDESIQDTLMDLINYTAILKSYLKNKSLSK